MGDLLIRDLPDNIRQDLTEAARRAGHSLSEEAKRRLARNEEQIEPTPKSGKTFLEEIQALFAGIPDEEREEIAKIMDEVERERKTDFGRSFSFDE